MSPHQLEAGKNTDWKGPPVFRWKVLTAHREHRQLCLKLSDKWWGGHQKGGVTIWMLMEGASGQRTPSHDYVLQKPEVTLWSRHMGEQEKTHKPTHMVQVQGGSSEIKTRAHLECGVMRVIQTLTDANMSASFWWHDLYDHTHTHTNGGNLLPTWNLLATGPQDRHEFTGASGQSHLYCNSGQPQDQKGLTNQ